MRFIIVFMILLAGWGSRAMGQIQFRGCGNVIPNTYYDGKILYAIQDQNGMKPFGEIIFTPAEGGHPWTFTWTYNGVSQPVRMEDTLSLEVDIMGDGYYTFEAKREGVPSVSTSAFHVFYDHVPKFTIHLSDIYNCTAIGIDAITDFVIPEYTVSGNVPYYGDKTHIYYLVSGKEVPRQFLNYEYAFTAKEEAVAVTSKDQDITVSITDKFGFEWTSESASYVSVIPKAVPEIILRNTVDIVGEVNEEMGQAPLEVEFNADECVNADDYQWLLYKDTSTMGVIGSALLDSLIGEQIRMEDHFVYTYENTGRYKVRLIAVNTVGLNQCKDTSADKYINVIESLLEVPNVFTPNGDGKNDVFMVKGLSLEDFHGVILNRWGRKVYEWSDTQGGWDGRIHGKYANPGTYYYIITARGREKSNPPKYVKKGALMLIR